MDVPKSQEPNCPTSSSIAGEENLPVDTEDPQSSRNSTTSKTLLTITMSSEPSPLTPATPREASPQSGPPRFSKKNKSKTSKCKGCNYIGTTQEDVWRHIRTVHLPKGKGFKCNKEDCLFATWYKHHLKYHTMNHSGEKPFKCTQCNYTCKNKAMLNSHRKSHSNVQPYKCKDCGFVSKFYHNMKVHLRDNCHKADVILNADGTPNPDKFIDVYGTRRGPKEKSCPVEIAMGDIQPATSGNQVTRNNAWKKAPTLVQPVSCGLQAQLRGKSSHGSSKKSKSKPMPINQSPPSQSLPQNSDKRAGVTFSGLQVPHPLFTSNPFSSPFSLQNSNGHHAQLVQPRLPTPALTAALIQNIMSSFMQSQNRQSQAMNLGLNQTNQRGMAMADDTASSSSSNSAASSSRSNAVASASALLPNDMPLDLSINSKVSENSYYPEEPMEVNKSDCEDMQYEALDLRTERTIQRQRNDTN